MSGHEMHSNSDAIQKVPPIQMTSVMADSKHAFMRVKSRWNYVSPFLDVWKKYIKYRTYSVLLLLAGLWALLSVPVISVLCFAGSVYYWELKGVQQHRLESKRTVMIGH